MALFVWKDSYSVNNTTLDAQHKRLIELINRLFEAMKDGKGKAVVGGVLTELSSYTVTHFADEERRMIACGYQGYAAHKRLHDEFAKQVGDFLEKYRAGSLSVTQELLQTLKSWLINHIEKVDKAYAGTLTDRSAA